MLISLHLEQAMFTTMSAMIKEHVGLTLKMSSLRDWSAGKVNKLCFGVFNHWFPQLIDWAVFAAKKEIMALVAPDATQAYINHWANIGWCSRAAADIHTRKPHPSGRHCACTHHTTCKGSINWQHDELSADDRWYPPSLCFSVFWKSCSFFSRCVQFHVLLFQLFLSSLSWKWSSGIVTGFV